MIRKQFILIFSFSLLIGNILNAQQKFTLEQCILYAIENNINLKDYTITEKMSHENLKQSKRNMLPGIGASTSAGYSFGRSIDPNTNDYVNNAFFSNSYSMGASVTVFNGFRLQNQIKYERFRKEISKLNTLKATDDLAFEVMTSFYNVLYYQGLEEIAGERVKASKLNLKTTETEVEVGLKAKTDLLEMRANLEAEELDKIQVENALETAILQLKQQMNFVSYEKLDIVENMGFPINEEIINSQDLFNQFALWSPAYKTFETNLDISRKALSLRRSQLYPSISASASAGSGYSKRIDSEENIGFSRQLKNRWGQSIRASLSIPVFSRWANRSNVKIAKLGIERAKNDLEKERQNLFFEIQNDLNDLKALLKEYKQFEKRKEVDTLAFLAAEKKLKQGLINIVEYYIAKNRLANTKSQVLRSKTQWEMKMKTIQFYKGNRFWEK